MDSFDFLARHQIPVLYEDNHLVVLSKPAGLLSQGEKTGDVNLVDLLRECWGRPYVGLVHRLDRNTSGLMVVAKRTKGAQRLSLALQEGRLLRTYQAWCLGAFPIGQAVDWRHWLLKNPKTNEVQVVASGAQKGTKQAVLHAVGLDQKKHPQEGMLSLLEFRLDTGRSHQIRVQSAESGFPLLGDTKYGPTERIRFWKQNGQRLALHSVRIEVPHPVGGKILVFEENFPKKVLS